MNRATSDPPAIATFASFASVASIMLGAVLAACAAQAPQQVQPVQQRTVRYEPDPHKQEIMLLWKEIRDWRADAGLVKREPTGALKRRSSSYSVDAARAVCPHDRAPQTPACRDVCSLADNICDNADSICRISDEDLKGDAWAQEKCDSAKASCKQAKQRCCKCNGSSHAPPAPHSQPPPHTQPAPGANRTVRSPSPTPKASK